MAARRNIWLGLISALLAAALVVVMFHVQQQQLTSTEGVPVLAAAHYMDAGTTVSANDVVWVTLPEALVSRDMLLSAEDVLGAETVMPLGSGEPLLRWKLAEYALLPAQGEATFQIPREYVLSVADSIRAGDRVRVYAVLPDGETFNLFADEVVVASVKTGGNRELDSDERSALLARARGDLEQMYVARREANGSLEQINLNLLEEQWLKLVEWCGKQDARLVIAFVSMGEGYELRTED